VLDNLGDQAMEYTVRVYLVDINRSLQTQTEIRTEIVKALRQAGIDIPYFAVQVGHATGPQAAPDRVTVRINVALNSDPDIVLEVLSAAACRCPGALAEPGPQLTFDNVGDSALEFSASVAVAAGETASRVETALRVAAVKMLRARGISLGNTHAGTRSLDGLGAQLYATDNDPAPHRAPDERAGHESGKPSRSQ
jgi:potassium efflux system protein